MKFRLLYIAVLIFVISACNNHNHESEGHDHEEDNHSATEAKDDHDHPNSVVFTHEQCKKIDFSCECPQIKPMGTIIKTTALVEPSQGSEFVVVAKSSGTIRFASDNTLEGVDVKAGQSLATVSGSGFAENSVGVKYAEAKSNYEKASAEYNRARELSADKIVSAKEFQNTKNQYETAKAVYDNLKSNSGVSGQKVVSPISGFVKQIFVKNGEYVDEGQTVMTVAQSKTLKLTAEVSQRYAGVTGSINGAVIQVPGTGKTYELSELNGKILSRGQSATSDSYMIPVNLQVDNKGDLVPGSFVKIFLKTITNKQALTIPLSSIIEEQGNFYVWVKVHTEMYEKREVKTGANDGKYVEILNGITSGDSIVTRGAMSIKLAQATGALDAHSGHVH